MKTLNVLTLDDDPRFNKFLESKITTSLFSVFTTTTVKEFVGKLRKSHWDFLLIDLHLNEGDEAGFSVIKFLRGNLGMNVPIIVLSRSDDKEKISHALECGANDYLIKPFDKDMFLAKIQFMINEDFQIGSVLKTFSVPSSFRQASLLTTFTIHAISEEGVTLKGRNFISKGTRVEISDSLLNEILKVQSLKLMVVKNAKIADDLYSMFLEFDREDSEYIEKAREWIINKMESE